MCVFMSRSGLLKRGNVNSICLMGAILTSGTGGHRGNSVQSQRAVCQKKKCVFVCAWEREGLSDEHDLNSL